MFDLLHEITQTMSHNKLRTALTGIAVSWGIFMLIVLLGMSQGVLNAFTGSFMNSGSDQINAWGGITSKPHAGYKEGRRVTLRDNDGERVSSDNSDHIDSYSYTINNNSAVISTQRDYTNGYSGCYPSQASAQNLTVTQGRFINDADMDGCRKVAVLARESASTLLGPDSTAYIGSRVTIGGFSFLVVGVYDHDWAKNVFIPFSTAKKLNGDSPDVNQMTIKIKHVNTEADGDAVESELLASLSKQHDFAPDDKSAVWIWNRFTQHLKMSSGLGLLDIAVWVIGILTMLSGIVGVSNIMFVSVKERTHEIGIRRAIGAKPRNILTQVITESVFITALFGYIGVVAGVIVTALLGKLFENVEAISDPGIDIGIALKVTMVLIVAGSVAGLFPAMKAIKVKPVEALRDE